MGGLGTCPGGFEEEEEDEEMGSGEVPVMVTEKTGEARRDAVKKRRMIRSRPIDWLATGARSFFIDVCWASAENGVISVVLL
jgi:hypothetical protein